MISDAGKLKIITECLTPFLVAIIYYNTYLILRHIHATEYMWFVFTVMVICSFLFSFISSSIQNYSNRIKALEGKVRRLEER